MKKRFSEEQIIGFLQEAEAGCRSRSCAVDTASVRRTTCGAASSGA